MKKKSFRTFIDSIIFKKNLVSKEDVLDVMAISLTLEKSIKLEDGKSKILI